MTRAIFASKSSSYRKSSRNYKFNSRWSIKYAWRMIGLKFKARLFNAQELNCRSRVKISFEIVKSD